MNVIGRFLSGKQHSAYEIQSADIIETDMHPSCAIALHAFT